MTQVPVSSGSSNRAIEWIVNGWRSLREKAAHAITYFSGHADDAGNPSPSWGVLASDVIEHPATVEVELELPGLKKSDLHVEVIDDQLVVSGEKKTSSTRRDGALIVTERAYGSFQRALKLPCPVDPAQTTAVYNDGILSISLAKRSPRNARRIPVTAA